MWVEVSLCKVWALVTEPSLPNPSLPSLLFSTGRSSIGLREGDCLEQMVRVRETDQLLVLTPQVCGRWEGNENWQLFGQGGRDARWQLRKVG